MRDWIGAFAPLSLTVLRLLSQAPSVHFVQGTL
jgi:hypothetical protein